MGMGSRPRDERNDTEKSLAGPLGNFELGLFISAGYIYTPRRWLEDWRDAFDLDSLRPMSTV